MEDIEFNTLVGKTIKSVVQKKSIGYDDKGFLEITFTDDTTVVIVSRCYF